jgi:hypothetical protein
MQSLLQGLPLETQSYEYYQPSGIEAISGAMSTGTDIYDQISNYLKGISSGGVNWSDPSTWYPGGGAPDWYSPTTAAAGVVDPYDPATWYPD